MGIKGIYGEIGAGRRVALAKLNADKLEDSGRPLRIAIDVSIWLFQVQSSRGGANPALRTLYYRLVRLLGLNVHPLFVFDGPNRPAFKRNAATRNGGQIISRQARRLLNLFNFPYRIAPGEAEAECAALQQHGVVDYVLSEDVDTLAFGCSATMRNWSGINERGRGPPTHVSVFDAASIKAGKSGLDSPGMVLVALMSGGDYIPAGVPRCGIKLACEAARAGFGHDLCQIAPGDDAGFDEWRLRLRHELETNDSGFFRTKHKALEIPDSFPDRTVLRFHAHPDVSSPEDIQFLKENLEWGGDLDIRGLRDFVDEEFEWKHLSGAKKFLRNIAPSLLSYKLYKQAALDRGTTNLDEQTEREERLVASLMAIRHHMSTDGCSEIKVSYIPGLVVGLDLDNERDEEEMQSEGSSDEELELNEEARSRSVSPVKRSRLKEFDPWKPRQTWTLEKLVQLGAPLTLERWETAMRAPQSAATNKTRGRDGAASGGMRQGALESFLRVSKPGMSQQALSQSSSGEPMDPYEIKARQKTANVGASTVTLLARSTPKPAKTSKSRAKSPTKPAKESSFITPWTLARANTNPIGGDMEVEQYGPDGSTKATRTRNSRNDSRINIPHNAEESSSRNITKALADLPKQFQISSVPVTSDIRVAGREAETTATKPGFSATIPFREVPKLTAQNNSPTDPANQRHQSTNTKPEKARPKHSSVVIRESLEGTWKLAEDLEDFVITSRRRFSDVDVLDMTNA